MSFQKLPAETLRKHKGTSFPGVTTAFICHDGNGNIFMTKRSNRTRDEHGRWDFGAGGLKHGQSLIENLKRELKEEYDAIAKRIDFIGYLDAFRKNHEDTPTHWLAMFFAVHVDPEQIRIMEPDMVDDHGWFKLDSLPEPLHSMMTTFIDEHGVTLTRLLSA